MQLDLTTFESDIDATILQRGQKYFLEGHVTNLEELVKEQWYAEVAGSDSYEVEITLARTKVKHFECSCPYDLGPVCKHVVAVLYALQKNNRKSPKSKAATTKDKTPTKKELLQEILDNVSYPELKAFLLEYALKKNEFGGVLLARFAEQTGLEGKEKYVLIIKNAISAAAGRSRFIEYQHVAKVMKPIKELLQQAHTLYGRKHYAEVVILCQAVIEEISELVQRLDDSAGHAVNAIEEAFKLLLQLSEEPIPLPLQQTLFTYALVEIAQPRYSANGSHLFWYEILDKLARNKDQENQVIAFVQSQLAQHSQQQKTLSADERMFRSIVGNFFNDDFRERQLTMYLVKFYVRRERQPEADALMQQYRHIPQFREILLQRAFQEQKFELAKQQVQEAQALEKAAKGFNQPGTHWLEWLLRIAKAEKNELEVRSLAATLFYQTYTLNYYRQYKQTYPAETWPAEYEKLIKKVAEAEKKTWQARGQLVPIFMEEQDWEKLFDYVRKKPSLELLLQTSPCLQPRYGEQMLELFRNTLFTFADENVNKSSYEVVVQVLLHLLTLEGGKKVVSELLTDFRELFKKRRTMMAELDKVKVD